MSSKRPLRASGEALPDAKLPRRRLDSRESSSWRPENGAGPFGVCGDELALSIGAYLPSRDLLSLALTCRRFGARNGADSVDGQRIAPNNTNAIIRLPSENSSAAAFPQLFFGKSVAYIAFYNIWTFGRGSTAFGIPSSGGNFAECTVLDHQDLVYGGQYNVSFQSEDSIGSPREATQWIDATKMTSVDCMTNNAEQLLQYFVAKTGAVTCNAKAVAQALMVDYTFVEAIARNKITSMKALLKRRTWSLMEEVAFRRVMGILEVEYDGCFEWREMESWLGISHGCERELEMVRESGQAINSAVAQTSMSTAQFDNFLDVRTQYAEILAVEFLAADSAELAQSGRYEVLSQALKLPDAMNLTTQKAKDVMELVTRYENGINCVGTLTDKNGSRWRKGQVAAGIAYIRHRGVSGPFIIVAPSSAVHCWVREFETWAPAVPTTLLVGTLTEREALHSGILNPRNKKQPDFPVIITSYEVLIQDMRKVSDLGEYTYLVLEAGTRFNDEISALLSIAGRIRSLNRVLLCNSSIKQDPVVMWDVLHFLRIIYDSDFNGNVCRTSEWTEDLTAKLTDIWKAMEIP